MRKYPLSLTNCTAGSDCKAMDNPLVLRTVRETYTDMEEVCCEGYTRNPSTG